MFRLALLSFLFGTASAGLSADSVPGKHLMSKARSLENNYYEQDLSWMAKFSIKFNSCHSIHSWNPEGQGEESNSPYGSTHLVNFQLCPSDKGCRSCSGGGDYVVELNEFVEAYTQAKSEMEEANCQAVEENCNCNYYYGDDQSCLSNCYKKAGLDYCGENNENEFDVAEYMECREAEFGNYYNLYYIGPVCNNNGKSINLQLFTDANCMTAAKSGVYEKYNYGYALPYSKKSIVSSECFSCKDQEENEGDDNNNDQNKYYQYEEPKVIEMCEEMYEASAKCETNLKYKNSAYRDTGSCDYIHNVLPALETVYKHGGGGAATAFAILFAMSTIAASAAAYYFYNKVERTTVDLSKQESSTFA